MLRNRVRLLALAALASLGTGCALLGGGGKKMETGVVYRTFTSEVSGQPRQYATWIPAEYNDSRRKWPLIFFLHGFGEQGDDVTKMLVHGPLKEAAAGRKIPFIIVAPQRPKVELVGARDAWKDIDEDLMKILGEVRRDYRVDAKRMYLTGISMGGFGTFAEAALHAGMWAAVAPVCGGGDPMLAKSYIGTPFWIFHGQKDRIVRPNLSVEMHDIMKQYGVDVKLTLYPELEHDSWSATYANDELYAWFLSHSLSKAPKGAK